MNPAFELLQFLVRSDNRVAVLMALAPGASPTCSELQRKTGIPRSTLSRILSELGDRELVSSVGHRHEVTPLGRFLAEKTQSVFDSIEAIQRLQTLLKRLSNTDVDIAFTDHTRTELLTPTLSDPGAPTRRFADLLQSGSHLRLLVPTVVPVLFEVDTAIGDYNPIIEVVIPCGALTMKEDGAMSQQLRDAITFRDVTLFSYDGDIHHFAGTVDEIAIVGLTDDAGAIQGYVETTAEEVRSWAEATVESYKLHAKYVVPGDLERRGLAGRWGQL